MNEPIPALIVDARFLGINEMPVGYSITWDGEVCPEFFTFEIVRVVRGSTKAKHVIVTDDEDTEFEIGKRYFFESDGRGPWKLHAPRLVRKNDSLDNPGGGDGGTRNG